MAVRTAWAVSSGEYSDYTVHCLFETKELAEGYVAAVSANEDAAAKANGEEARYRYRARYRIETFQLWSSIPVLGIEEREFPRWEKGKPAGTYKRWVTTEEGE